MRPFLLILLLMAGIVSGAFAQEILDLQQAIAIGLKNNYGILIAGNKARISANDASPGNAGFLPVIDASGAYTLGLNDVKLSVVSGQEMDKSSARSDLMTAGVNLHWHLFDGLDMFITYDRLKKMEEMGELQVKMEVEHIVAAIIVAYYHIIRQEQEVQIFNEQVAISRFRLDLARLMYETGSGSELEWLKARVELNADLSELAILETEYENSRTYMNELLAREIDIRFVIHDSIPLQDTLSMDSLRNWMKISNRSLQISEKAVEVSGQEVKSARAQQIPFIDFIAGYNYYRNETQASFINYNRYFGPTVGIIAGVKIFDGLNLRRQYENSKISLINSQLERDRLILRLDAYLFRMYNDYRNQFDLVGFEQNNLLLAERNMDVARESYSVGAISSLNLREIQKNLLDARQRYLTARFRTKVKETELLLISGRLIN